jgi:hypothetical protein
MKLYINFSGVELKMESTEERLAWSQLRQLFKSADLVEGAGVAMQQSNELVLCDNQVVPS